MSNHFNGDNVVSSHRCSSKKPVRPNCFKQPLQCSYVFDKNSPQFASSGMDFDTDYNGLTPSSSSSCLSPSSSISLIREEEYSPDTPMATFLPTPTTPLIPLPHPHSSSPGYSTGAISPNSDCSSLNSSLTSSSASSYDPLMTDAILNYNSEQFSDSESQSLASSRNTSNQRPASHEDKTTVSFNYGNSTNGNKVRYSYTMQENKKGLNQSKFSQLVSTKWQHSPPYHRHQGSKRGSVHSSSHKHYSSSNHNNQRKRHLLQFIIDLLSDPSQLHNSSVEWVNRSDRIFKISDPTELTNMWGEYKNNMNMSFESLSRSLRLYYAPGKLERIQGRRHQYRLLGNSHNIP